MSFTSAVLHSLEWDHAGRQRALVLVLRNLDREKINEVLKNCETQLLIRYYLDSIGNLGKLIHR